MKTILTTTAALLVLAAPAFASGDVDKGEKEFNKCKACHMVVSPDGEEIVKGGKTGPNLYGIVGRVAGTEEGFKYGNGLQDAAAAEHVWTEDELVVYMEDPKKWLDGHGFAAKTKMTFKMKKNQEDVAAFLAAHSPAAEGAEEKTAD